VLSKNAQPPLYQTTTKTVLLAANPLLKFVGDFEMKLSHTLIALSMTGVAFTANADPVELNKVDNRISSKYGYSWQTIEVEAIVENLSYDKDVVLHYQENDNTWTDLTLTYRGIANPGKEIWATTISRTLNGPYTQGEPLDLEFVLKMQANGETYWDNNSSQNYSVPAGSGEFTPKAIVVDSSFAQSPYDYSYNGNTTHVNGYFRAEFIVPNWGYSKNVEVHYSYDNWATSHIGQASFMRDRMEGYSWVKYPNANNMEVWSFYSNGTEAQDESASNIQFAVKYTVNDTVYWNNNDGFNFNVSIQN
jgi:hypothetical protein